MDKETCTTSDYIAAILSWCPGLETSGGVIPMYWLVNGAVTSVLAWTMNEIHQAWFVNCQFMSSQISLTPGFAFYVQKHEELLQWIPRRRFDIVKCQLPIWPLYMYQAFICTCTRFFWCEGRLKWDIRAGDNRQWPSHMTQVGIWWQHMKHSYNTVTLYTTVGAGQGSGYFQKGC